MSNAQLETAIEAAWEARDAITPATTGEQRDAVSQFRVADGLLGLGDRAVVDQRGLFAPTCLQVAVQRIVAGIDRAPGKPAVEGGI